MAEAGVVHTIKQGCKANGVHYDRVTVSGRGTLLNLPFKEERSKDGSRFMKISVPSIIRIHKHTVKAQCRETIY